LCLKEIVDKKNLTEITLIGCSYGGSIALDFTLKYPENNKEIFKRLFIANKNFYNGNYGKKYILKPIAIKRLCEINTDVLLIIGDNDSNFNKHVSMKLKEKIKNTKYCTIKNCGHLLNIEKNEKVNRIIEEFLS